jgi:hypothetical protein
MDQLPDDMLMEISRRLSLRDIVMLGASSKGMYALARKAVGNNMCTMTDADMITYAIYALLKDAGLFRPIDDGTYIGYIYKPMPSLRMDVGFCQYTSSLRSYPSEWRNNINKEVEVDGLVAHVSIVMRLRVDPERWVFDFSMFLPEYIHIEMEPDAIQRVLYRITKPEERRIMSMALLASWYAHAHATMNGRRLRSHTKNRWFPDELPRLYDYVSAAHASMDAFVHGK